MKALFTFLILLGLSVTLSAQTGIYMTYDDFKAGKLLRAEGDNLSIKMKHEITMKVGGTTQTYQTKDFYAMLLDGELYRFSPTSMGNLYLKLTTVNDHYAMWWYVETRYYNNGSHERSTIIYISKGLDGKMIDISTNGQLKALEEQGADYKDLLTCIKGKGKLTMFHNLSRGAGECIYDDPTNKKDPKSVIPPIK